MTNKTDFTIQSLLSWTADGVTGAMSPMLFAKEMAQQMKMKFNRLSRVWFRDQNVNQIYEKGEGLTGFDTLLIASKCKSNSYIGLWWDKGVYGIPIALMFEQESEPTYSPMYESQTDLQRKLTQEEIKEILLHCFATFDESFRIDGIMPDKFKTQPDEKKPDSQPEV